MAVKLESHEQDSTINIIFNCTHCEASFTCATSYNLISCGKVHGHKISIMYSD